MALSNYLIDRNPNSYGGRQEDYLRQSEEIISAGVGMIQAGKDFECITQFFQKRRGEIAEQHQTLDARLFGTSRLWKELENNFASTPLAFDCEEYNQIYFKQLEEIFVKMGPSIHGFSSKKGEKEDFALGRKCKFEVTVADTKKFVFKATEVASEENLQKVLKTDKNYFEIVADQDLMRQLREKDAAVYNCLTLSVFVSDFMHRFPNELKKNLVLGRLSIEIDGKMCIFSKYLSSYDLDGKSTPIDLVKKSKTLIGHLDIFQIPAVLKHIGSLFREDVQSHLKERVMLIRILYAQCTPCVRGDGAIGDWIELLLYRYHGFSKTAFNQKRLPCFETLASISLSRYRDQYDEIIRIT